MFRIEHSESVFRVFALLSHTSFFSEDKHPKQSGLGSVGEEKATIFKLFKGPLPIHTRCYGFPFTPVPVKIWIKRQVEAKSMML